MKFRSLLDKINHGALYVTVGNLVSALLGGIMWLALAIILLPQLYGEFNYHISAAFLGSVIGLFGLSTVNTSFIAKKKEKELEGIYFVSFVISLIVAIIIGLVFASIAMATLVFSIVTFTMSVSSVLGKQKFKEYMILLVSQKAIQLALVFLFVFTANIDELIFGYAVAYLALSYRFFTFLLRLRPSTQILHSIKTSLHSMSMDFTQSSTLFFDKIIIGPFFGFFALGLYQVGVQFLMMLAVIPTGLFFYLLPSDSQGKNNSVIRRLSLIISVLLAIISFFLAEEVLTSFFPKYIDALPVIQILVFGIIPMTLIAGSNSRMIGAGKSSVVFLGAVLFVCIDTSLIFLLYPLQEVVGLSIALLLALSAQAGFLKVYETIYR